MEENTFPKPQPSVGQSALTYALILSAALIVSHLVLFLIDVQKSAAGWIVPLVLGIAGIVVIMWHFRGQCGGFIAYGKALSIGFVSILFASVIVSGYTFVYHSYINPVELQESYQEQATKTALEIDKNDDMSVAEKDKAKKVAAKIMSYIFVPWVFALLTIFIYALFGIILSLIIAIFIKKQEPFPTFEESA